MGNGAAMQLTAEMYREILRSLRSDSHSSRNLEKRGAPRVGLRSKISVIHGGRAPAITWCRDLSMNGIGLVHTESMPVGSQFTAMFPGHANDALAVIYTVVNCKELSKSLFSIGASLARVERAARLRRPPAA
jgi:hypothetical protein